MNRDTTSQEFFDEKYRQHSDPWSFGKSEYEQSRYSTIVKALGHCRYIRAFEPGCSIGLLTARLASFCSRVDAIDISPVAAEEARKNCRSLPNVVITPGALPAAMPDGTFDLIVFSEIGYYFTEEQLVEVTGTLLQRLRTPGTVVATHWLGKSEDHVLSGDRVHEITGEVLGSGAGLHHTISDRILAPDGTPGFRLDRWDRM